MTDNHAGFKVVADQTAWTGARWSAAEVKVEGPNGEVVERQVIHHPGAVGVLPLHDDGTVTLLRQYRVALNADMWEIPAGLRDVEGEPPELTAERELIEEAGLSARHFLHLVTFHNSVGMTDEATWVYLATELEPVDDDRQGVEEQHMTVERMPLEQALTMLDQGHITDAKTVIALSLTKLRR